MELLKQKNITASEVAYRTGFGSPAYFNTCFHEYYGYPPGGTKTRNCSALEGNDEIVDRQLVSEVKKSIQKKISKKIIIYTTSCLLVLVIIYFFQLS
jgi:AraC-like DNA-binding protein